MFITDFSQADPFRKFDRFLVTGPQRSGTHFCAHAIATDLGTRARSELLNTKHIAELIQLKKEVGIVVAPAAAAAPKIHAITGPIKQRTLIVWMVRPVEDVLASAKRIGWKDDLRDRYPEEYRSDDFVEQFELRHKFWREVQRPTLPNWVEVHYNDLSKHPLFVQKELRKDFRPNQVTP